MNKPGTALIGCGYWGSRLMKYIPEQFELIMTADSKTDLNEIWEDKNIESVIIATPIDTHYELTTKALQSYKHVFVEKPVAMKEIECKNIIDFSIITGKRIGVEYTQTFTPAVKMLNTWIKDIGGIGYIEMATKHLGRFLDYNVYWLLASHHLSILATLCNLEDFNFSKKTWQSHTLSSHKTKSIPSNGTIFFNGPFEGRIDVNLNYTEKEMYVNIYGPNGTIIYNPLRNPSLRLCQYKPKLSAIPKEMITEITDGNWEEKNNLEHSIKYFRDLVDGKAKSNLINATKITKVLEELELK